MKMRMRPERRQSAKSPSAVSYTHTSTITEGGGRGRFGATAAENPQLFNRGPWSCVWRDVLSPSQTFRKARRRNGTSVISSCNLEITVIARDQRKTMDFVKISNLTSVSLIFSWLILRFCVVPKNLTSTTVTRDFITL